MIHRIEVGGAGLKGETFDLDLSHPNLFLGPNGAGKTRRIHAFVAALTDWRTVPGISKDAATTILAAGPDLTIDRHLGDETSVTVTYGRKSEKTLAKGQVLIESALGRTPALIWDLGGLTRMSADKRRAELLRVAEVDERMTGEGLSERLLSRLVDNGENWLNNLKQAVKDACPPGTVDAVSWTAQVRKSFGDARRSCVRELDRAQKTRRSLPNLDKADPPPGTIRDKRQTVNRLEVKATDRQQRLAAAVSAEIEAVRAMESRAEEIATLNREIDSLRAEVAEYRDPAVELGEVEDLRYAVDLARENQAEAEHTFDRAKERFKREAEIVESLKKGLCPTCGTRGDELGPAIVRLEFAHECTADDVQDAAASNVVAKEAVGEAEHVLYLATQRDKHLEMASRLEAAESHLAAMAGQDKRRPGAEDKDALKTELAETQAQLAHERHQLEEMVRHEAMQAADLANRQTIADLESEVGAWKTLESEVQDIESNLLSGARDSIMERATSVIAAVMGGGWRLGIDPQTWEIHVSPDNLPRPWKDLSDGERAIAGAGLCWAMLARQPYRAMVLDGLGEVDDDRVARLLAWADERMRSGELHAFLGAVRCSTESNRASWYSMSLQRTGVRIWRL